MNQIATAIVGCGNAGPNQHVPAIEINPRTTLAAVCDLDEDRVRSVAHETGATAYTDVEQMLAEEDLDAVHICTPPQTHVAIAKTVLEAGIPALIEKPAAMNSEEVRELMDVVDETGTLASVVHNKLFLPFVRKALGRVESGEIGEIVSATMLFSKDENLLETPRGDWVYELPGGELGEGSPHQAYVPLEFVGRLDEVVCVSKQNFADYDEPIEFDGVSIEAQDTAGRLITIKILTNSVSQDQLHVHGTDGELRVDFMKKGTFDYTTKSGFSAGSLVTDSLDAAGQHVYNVAKNGFSYLEREWYRKQDDERGERSNGHYVVIDQFVDAVLGRGEPPVPLEDAYDTMRILEALEE